MLVVRDVAEEAEAQVPAQGDDVQELAAEEVVTNVVPPTPTPPSPPSPVIPYSPLHQPPCPPQPQDAEVPSLLLYQGEEVRKINMVKSSKLRRLKKVGTSQRVESSDDMEHVFNQGRIIADMDQDKGIELVADQEKDVKFKGRHADKQAEIYNIDLDHSSKVLSMQEDDTEVQKAVEIVTTAKLMTEVVTVAATQPKILNITAAPAVSTRRRKGVVIRDPEEELPSDIPAETSKGMKYNEILLIFQAKFDAIMRFLFKSREEIEEEDEEIIKSINETPAQKAAKRRKL
nr:hypothetical protein [Tanacetum cinerariifolium]